MGVLGAIGFLVGIAAIFCLVVLGQVAVEGYSASNSSAFSRSLVPVSSFWGWH